MYISPYVVGVMAVLLGELIGLIVYIVVQVRRTLKAERAKMEDNRNEIE